MKGSKFHVRGNAGDTQQRARWRLTISRHHVPQTLRQGGRARSAGNSFCQPNDFCDVSAPIGARCQKGNRCHQRLRFVCLSCPLKRSSVEMQVVFPRQAGLQCLVLRSESARPFFPTAGLDVALEISAPGEGKR